MEEMANPNSKLALMLMFGRVQMVVIIIQPVTDSR